MGPGTRVFQARAESREILAVSGAQNDLGTAELELISILLQRHSNQLAAGSDARFRKQLLQ